MVFAPLEMKLLGMKRSERRIPDFLVLSAVEMGPAGCGLLALLVLLLLILSVLDGPIEET